MIKVEFRGIKEARKDLKKLERAIPYAVRAYTNDAAFLARGVWIRRAGANMTLRSKWTERSLRVVKAGLKPGTTESRVGSVEDYMRTQEDGDTQGAKGKHGVPIPAASPGGRKRRKSKVGKANQLGNLKLSPQAKVGGSRYRRNAAAVAMAARKGGGVVFLDLKKAKGLYRVFGSKRGENARGRGGIRVRKVWDLSKRSVRIPANPMLQETLRIVGPQLPHLATKAVLFQVKRHRLFGY